MSCPSGPSWAESLPPGVWSRSRRNTGTVVCYIGHSWSEGTPGHRSHGGHLHGDPRVGRTPVDKGRIRCLLFLSIVLLLIIDSFRSLGFSFSSQEEFYQQLAAKWNLFPVIETLLKPWLKPLLCGGILHFNRMKISHLQTIPTAFLKNLLKYAGKSALRIIIHTSLEAGVCPGASKTAVVAWSLKYYTCTLN